MSSSSVAWPLERRRHFQDGDGNMAFSKRDDEITQVVLNWDSQIGGDAISSVAYEDHGVTRSSTTNTGSTTTTSVTGSGYFEITVTLTSGRKLQRIVRFISTDGGEKSDYRG